MQSSDQPAQLRNNEAVFELSGAMPSFLWVQTCEAPKCGCRKAFVLTTTAGTETLLKEAAIARRERDKGVTRSDIAQYLIRSDHFFLDIDTARPFWIRRGDDEDSDEEVDVIDHPRVGPVGRSLDGELLEEIGRLWYQGKGLPDPEKQQLAFTREVHLSNWAPGNLVAWDELVRTVRKDHYCVGRHIYQAQELYCPLPNCHCNELSIVFVGCDTHSSMGYVDIDSKGVPDIHSMPGCREQVVQLWEAYRQRHPRYLERMQRRLAHMKKLGRWIEMPAAFRHTHDVLAEYTHARMGIATPAPRRRAAEKVGRNDPCPCGSGQKFKKCCGAGAE